MMEPVIPLNETQRLNSLRSFDLLDTLEEEEYDAIVTLASTICNTPISLISLVDSERQWFKAAKGLSAKETPRKYAFCAHAINEPDQLLEVNNALQDARFADNPLVADSPNIRFYAGSPLVTNDGYALGTLCVIDDQPKELTDNQRTSLKLLAKQVMSFLEKRKKLLEENAALLKMKEIAEEASQRKSEFMSSISHEIRTPLNAIIGTINLMEIEDAELSANKRFQLLKYGSENLMSLINEALDFNKLEAGKIKLLSKAFDLIELLKNIKKSWESLAQQKGVDLILKYDQNIHRFYLGDRTRLGQVINNLVSNAVKFTDHGQIIISLTLAGEQLLFEIIDSGIGIPETKLNTVFESFSQIESNQQIKSTGTGLGLSISQKIIQLMGGQIQLKSTYGSGSNFYFRIPLEKVNSVKKEVASAPYEEQKGNGAIKLLLVEDNKGNQEIAKGFLKLWDITPDIANDGREAWDKVQESDYDLVLMDLRMPKLNGFEATMAIRQLSGEKFKKLPIVALTANMDQGIEEKVKKAGMNGHLCKPYSPAALKKTIDLYIG